MHSTRIALVAAVLAHGAAAQLPVSGLPVPELAALDDEMKAFMTDPARTLSSAVLGVMRGGEVIYLRGFGTRPTIADDGSEVDVAVSEVTPFRTASLEKIVTAAAIRRLAATDPAFALGDLVFDVDGSGGHIDVEPLGDDYGDCRLDQITIAHLLDHRGGWDNDEPELASLSSACPGVSDPSSPDPDGFDPMFQDIRIAKAIAAVNGTSSWVQYCPPTREQRIQYMLSRPLQFTPGTSRDYSNFGYLCLGLIVEQVSGMDYFDYVRQNVLTAEMGIPSTEVIYGRTKEEDNHPREPRYVDDDMSTDVFDPGGSKVEQPYGGWSLESFVGHGNMAMTVPTLLRLSNRYRTVDSASIGVIHGGAPPNSAFSGSLDGTSTHIRQRDDGIHIAVLFNEREDGAVPNYASQCATRIEQLVNDLNADAAAGAFTWPTAPVDGFWVGLYNGTYGTGGYHDPFPGMDKALANLDDGAAVRLKPGAKAWSGTIDMRIVIDAPEGTAVLGAAQ